MNVYSATFVSIILAVVIFFAVLDYFSEDRRYERLLHWKIRYWEKQPTEDLKPTYVFCNSEIWLELEGKINCPAQYILEMEGTVEAIEKVAQSRGYSLPKGDELEHLIHTMNQQGD